MKKYQEAAQGMLQFIQNSPSPYHVVENIKQTLAGKGYQELSEECPWEIGPGGKYFVVRNGSSLIAFQIPKIAEPAWQESVRGFHMIAAHSDSPTFKLKESPQMNAQESYVKLNTEKYGGMILSTWMDRVLSVAGRVTVKASESTFGVETRLVCVDEDLLIIPNLAIHMNREMNKGVEYNPQVDLLPLFGSVIREEGEDSPEAYQGLLMEKVAVAAGVSPDEILGHDLFLYVREKGRIVGGRGEFVSSPKLDDLQCVYAALEAFAESIPEKYINVMAIFDNEEVGSGTIQGADSTFLEDVLYRIASACEKREEMYRRWLAGSFLISADNAHAVHPNHPEKADPTNRPVLNGGVVIKYHGGQKYATDGITGAVMKRICQEAGVPFQTYANRSDILGGSTLGNISTAHVSVPSVDIGLPQLAMHSAVETAGVRDTRYGIEAFKVFWKE